MKQVLLSEMINEIALNKDGYVLVLQDNKLKKLRVKTLLDYIVPVGMRLVSFDDPKDTIGGTWQMIGYIVSQYNEQDEDPLPYRPVVTPYIFIRKDNKDLALWKRTA